MSAGTVNYTVQDLDNRLKVSYPFYHIPSMKGTIPLDSTKLIKFPDLLLLNVSKYTIGLFWKSTFEK